MILAILFLYIVTMYIFMKLVMQTAIFNRLFLLLWIDSKLRATIEVNLGEVYY